MPGLDIMPIDHRIFLETALVELQRDERIIGVAAGGSFISHDMDEFSDIDLVLAIEPNRFDEVMAERTRIASRLGRLVGAFTGEHVGEPRLLICLYDNPVLHVDLKFINLHDAGERVETPVVLWARDERFSQELSVPGGEYPAPDLQWIEDRFWIWVHYAATKIGRGELLEALDFLSFIRLSVLGPLSLLEAGARPSGVRKIELRAPRRCQEMTGTIARHDRRSCLDSVKKAVSIYCSLRESLRKEQFTPNTEAEQVARAYLLSIS